MLESIYHRENLFLYSGFNIRDPSYVDEILLREGIFFEMQISRQAFVLEDNVFSYFLFHRSNDHENYQNHIARKVKEILFGYGTQDFTPRDVLQEKQEPQVY